MRERVRFESSDSRVTVEQTFGCGKAGLSCAIRGEEHVSKNAGGNVIILIH
jgi:hypothetical protein